MRLDPRGERDQAPGRRPDLAVSGDAVVVQPSGWMGRKARASGRRQRRGTRPRRWRSSPASENEKAYGTPCRRSRVETCLRREASMKTTGDWRLATSVAPPGGLEPATYCLEGGGSFLWRERPDPYSVGPALTTSGFCSFSRGSRASASWVLQKQRGWASRPAERSLLRMKDLGNPGGEGVQPRIPLRGCRVASHGGRLSSTPG